MLEIQAFRRVKAAGLAAALALLALLCGPAPTLAQQNQPGLVPGALLGGGQPALISADELSYDENLGIASARGNVEVAQGDRVLFADLVTYNLNNNLVAASGNVSVLEPDGTVFFASYMELTSDLKEGFVRDIRILLEDNSRIAAADGTRVNGNLTTMNRAVFSPCELCEDDPTRAPLWQIRARQVKHDQEEREIIYNDAWLEIWGIPIFYTPYFAHPDPTVEKKTGLLTPTIRSNERLGFQYEQGFFWNIAPNQDLTITPRITTKQNVQLTLNYRLLQENGYLDATVSGTVADRVDNSGREEEDVFRGHADIRGVWEIDNTWRAGLNVNRATDDTYNRTYSLRNEPRLTSTVYAEGFRQRNYANVSATTYQALRLGDNSLEQPILLPMMEYNFVSEPGRVGGLYRIDASLMNLTRIDGRDSRRAAMLAAWELPYTGPAGDVYKLQVGVRGDAYWTHGVNPTNDLADPATGRDSDVTGRVFPYLAFQYRYPLISNHETFYQTLQPIIQFVAAPDWGNSGKIPNEDSQDFDFDDLNLFAINRFNGVDRVSAGSRVDYGLEWSAGGYDGGYIEAFIGQSYRFDKAGNETLYSTQSGVDDHLSDIVGRVYARPVNWLDLGYRVRLDKDDLNIRSQEIMALVGPRALNIEAYYSFTNGGIQSEYPRDRQELLVRLNAQVTDYWSGFVQHREDLEANRGLSTAVGVTYEDECFLINAIGEQTAYDDREIEKETRFYMTVSFKHLGDITIR